MLTIDIVGSQQTETPANLADFMKKNNYTFPALADLGMTVTRSYGIKSTPTNFLIDKDGIIRERRTGAWSSQEDFEESLKQISAR